LRAGDSISHPQDNKFWILLTDFNQAKDSARIAQRIVDTLRRPFNVEKQRIYLNVGIGLEIYENQDQPTLFNHTQIALNRSRQKGNNNYQFYHPNLTTEIQRDLRLEILLKEAIAKEELLLFYQPRVNIKTKKITAVEALLRWQHPEFGLIAPDKFLPIAEETGLMIPIGEWVIKKACQQNRTWQKLGLQSFPIAINLSGKQFKQPDLLPKIVEILSKIGLESRWLELELTEKVIMENLEDSRQILAELHSLGLSLALDDFNPLSSSVAYLKQFPFDSIKVHQSFIKELQEESNNMSAVASTIAMGREFNLKVVIEGVETTKQLTLFKDLHCEQMQGYLFSAPVNAEDIYEMLTHGESLFFG
jgi:EAL domain-containing protein (putative c-di-GMP-specific phosphodiesterase class I)